MKREHVESSNIESIFKKKKIKINKTKVIQVSKEYKKNYNEKLILDFGNKL